MKNNFLFLFLVAGLVFISFHGRASSDRATTSIEIASIFYKLTEKAPDFGQWARQTKAYKDAKSFDKGRVLEEEELYFREIFYNVFPDEPVIVQSLVSLNDYSDSQQKLFLKDFNKDTVFSYEFFGEKYVLIVPEMERFGEIPMTVDQIKEMTQEEENSMALIEMTILPVSADHTEPLSIFGVEQWPIVAKLMQFRIWDKNGKKLYWFYEADGYKEKNHIQDLYQ